MSIDHLHCQGTVIVNSKPKLFPTHSKWSQFGDTLMQNICHGVLSFYHFSDHKSFHFNFALNSIQKNFQNFMNHFQVNIIFEIDNEEGIFIV